MIDAREKAWVELHSKLTGHELIECQGTCNLRKQDHDIIWNAAIEYRDNLDIMKAYKKFVDAVEDSPEDQEKMIKRLREKVRG